MPGCRDRTDTVSVHPLYTEVFLPKKRRQNRVRSGEDRQKAARRRPEEPTVIEKQTKQDVKTSLEGIDKV
jgi:hypothetical protein